MSDNNKMKCYVCFEQPYDCGEPEKVYWYKKDAEAWVMEGDATLTLTDPNGIEYQAAVTNYRVYKEMEID